MSTHSRQQLKYIYAMRRKYKDKKNTPKHLRWIFKKDWTTQGVKSTGLPTKVKNFQTYVSENYSSK